MRRCETGGESRFAPTIFSSVKKENRRAFLYFQKKAGRGFF
jgi:hypothetical protein